MTTRNVDEAAGCCDATTRLQPRSRKGLTRRTLARPWTHAVIYAVPAQLRFDCATTFYAAHVDEAALRVNPICLSVRPSVHANR